MLSLFHRPYTFTHSTLKRTLPFGRARLHITLSYTLIQRISPQQCTQQLASPIVCTHTPNRLYNSRVTHTSPTSSAHNMDDLVLDDPRSWLEEGLQDTRSPPTAANLVCSVGLVLARTVSYHFDVAQSLLGTTLYRCVVASSCSPVVVISMSLWYYSWRSMQYISLKIPYPLMPRTIPEIEKLRRRITHASRG